MPVNRIRGIHLREVVRPLRVTFATSLGGKDVMRSIIVRVVLEDGSEGLGESPTSAAFPHETIPAMRSLLAGWARDLKGITARDGMERVLSLRRTYRGHAMAISGLETALFRAYLKEEGLAEHAYWGGKSKELETDITIPFIPGHPNLQGWINYAVRMGFKIFKVKVSGDVAQDKKFLAALHRELSERVSGLVVRLDGNQGYTKKTFFQMADHIEKAGYRIELFEQPLGKDDYRGLAEITRHASMPIILDETVVTADQAKNAAEKHLGHGINIKIAKSGIQASQDILRIAGESGMKLMMGCMTETMAGLSAAVLLAAGSGRFHYIDLDGVYFLRHRNRYGPIEIRPPRFFVASPAVPSPA